LAKKSRSTRTTPAAVTAARVSSIRSVSHSRRDTEASIRPEAATTITALRMAFGRSAIGAVRNRSTGATATAAPRPSPRREGARTPAENREGFGVRDGATGGL
jgi:hypothetical protein